MGTHSLLESRALGLSAPHVLCLGSTGAPVPPHVGYPISNMQFLGLSTRSIDRQRGCCAAFSLGAGMFVACHSAWDGSKSSPWAHCTMDVGEFKTLRFTHMGTHSLLESRALGLSAPHVLCLGVASGGPVPPHIGYPISNMQFLGLSTRSIDRQRGCCAAFSLGAGMFVACHSAWDGSKSSPWAHCTMDVGEFKTLRFIHMGNHQRKRFGKAEQ